eukprot:scaffold62347_cov60-Phaeocystis_antarctica.AAC.6
MTQRTPLSTGLDWCHTRGPSRHTSPQAIGSSKTSASSSPSHTVSPPPVNRSYVGSPSTSEPSTAAPGVGLGLGSGSR